jgi:hypothetical protein
MPTRQGELAFKPGIFLEAVRQGQWLVIDEINRAEIDKAFGELFTLLSDQQVQLPYQIGNKFVRIMPPEPMKGLDEDAYLAGKWYKKETAAKKHIYTIHPNWRIIGTMNVFDRSLLFAMSFAFMRRFAFVDVDLPEKGAYDDLCRRWLIQELKVKPEIPTGDETLEEIHQRWQQYEGLADWRLAALAMAMQAEHHQAAPQDKRERPEIVKNILGPEPPPHLGKTKAQWDSLLEKLAGHFESPQVTQACRDAFLTAGVSVCAERFVHLLNDESMLMQRRAIGPAITRDMIRYMAQHLPQAGQHAGFDKDTELDVLREACLLYIVPQLDGLDQETIRQVYQDLTCLLWRKEGRDDAASLQDGAPAEVMKRIRLLYLHIPDDRWASEADLIAAILKQKNGAGEGNPAGGADGN